MLHETGTTMPTRFETDLLIAHAHLVNVIQAWTEENATGAATTRSVPLEDPAGPGVEVTPKNSRAAKAYFRLETSTNVVRPGAPPAIFVRCSKRDPSGAICASRRSLLSLSIVAVLGGGHGPYHEHNDGERNSGQ